MSGWYEWKISDYTILTTTFRNILITVLDVLINNVYLSLSSTFHAYLEPLEQGERLQTHISFILGGGGVGVAPSIPANTDPT